MPEALRSATAIGGPVMFALDESWDQTPAVLLAASTVYKKGQLVRSQTFDGTFAPYLVAATAPVAGDIFGVILRDLTTGGAVEPQPVGMAGSVSQEYVVGASFAIAPTTPQLGAIKKALLLTGIYLRSVVPATVVYN